MELPMAWAVGHGDFTKYLSVRICVFMEHETGARGAPGGGRASPVNCLIVVLLVLYAVWVGLHVRAYGFGPDPSGYLNNARLLSKGMARAAQGTVPGLDIDKMQEGTFTPLAFRALDKRQMVTIYSPGLPLAVVFFAQLTGWAAAPHVTMFAMAMLGLLLTGWLAREMGLPGTWAWFAVLLLAAGPLFTQMSLILMSDVPALAAVTFAVICAWKSRERPGWALAAGVAVAYSVYVRPANVIVMAPVCVSLGLAWRRWALLALGGLPGGVLWCLYNHAANGHFLETGYGNTPHGFFDPHVIGATWIYYFCWLPILLTPAGVLALGLPWMVRSQGRRAIMLMAWILTFLCFYSVDIYTRLSWAALRFVLPAFPACLVGALMVAHAWAQSAPGRKFNGFFARYRSAGQILLVLLVVIYWKLCIHRLMPEKIAQYHTIFPVAAQWADDHLPADAVVIGSNMTGTLYYYTPFTIADTDSIGAEQWTEIVRACAVAHRPVYAAIMYPFDIPLPDRDKLPPREWEKLAENFLNERCPGKWEEAGVSREVGFWRLVTPE